MSVPQSANCEFRRTGHWDCCPTEVRTRRRCGDSGSAVTARSSLPLTRRTTASSGRSRWSRSTRQANSHRMTPKRTSVRSPSPRKRRERAWGASCCSPPSSTRKNRGCAGCGFAPSPPCWPRSTSTRPPDSHGRRNSTSPPCQGSCSGPTNLTSGPDGYSQSSQRFALISLSPSRYPQSPQRRHFRPAKCLKTLSRSSQAGLQIHC